MDYSENKNFFFPDVFALKNNIIKIFPAFNYYKPHHLWNEALMEAFWFEIKAPDKISRTIRLVKEELAATGSTTT